MRRRLNAAHVAALLGVLVAAAALLAPLADAAPRGTSLARRVAATAATLSVPPSSISYENAQANAVSCPTASSCTAVGSFQRSTSRTLAVLWNRGASGRWSTGAMVPLPAHAPSSAVSTLTSVACSAPESCIATGTYAPHDDEPSELMIVRERAGVIAPGVLVGFGPHYNAMSVSASAWCRAGGRCEVAGSIDDVPGEVGRLFSLAASTTGAAHWHGAPVVHPLVRPADLPKPNDGGSLDVEGFTCVSVGNCIAVGGMDWTKKDEKSLAFSELERDGSWGPVAIASLPADALGVRDAQFDAALASVACAGASPTLSASRCVAVGTYDSNDGAHELVERVHGGHLHVGAWPQDPIAGAYATTACRRAGLVCIAAGLRLQSGVPHSEAGAYSVGTWAGFATMVAAPFAVTHGGDLYDSLEGSACLPGRTTCLVVGAEVLGPGQPAIVVTLRGV